MVHCRKEIGDFQIICSKVGGFRPFNYLLGVTCYLLSLKCKWLVLNKLCNFTAYKLFVSTNKQLSAPMDSMADPLFSSYSVLYLIWEKEAIQILWSMRYMTPDRLLAGLNCPHLCGIPASLKLRLCVCGCGAASRLARRLPPCVTN